MLSDDKSIDNLKQLFIELRKYLEYQLEYAQLNIVDKLTRIIVMLILVFVCSVLGMMALFYLSLSLGFIIADYVGSLAGGFAIVALIIVAICAVVYALRQRIIVQPMVRFLASILLNNTEQKADNDEK